MLLRGGKTIPISEVQAGEKVSATDPYRHETAARSVVKVVRRHRWHAMAAVVLVTGAAIQATSQHPFWDVTTHRFTYAADLRPGDKLLEPGGQTIAVRAVRHYRADVTAYNLDISGIHTYYVLAGAAPVLVHNSCGVGTTVYRGVPEGHPAMRLPLRAPPPREEVLLLRRCISLAIQIARM